MIRSRTIAVGTAVVLMSFAYAGAQISFTPGVSVGMNSTMTVMKDSAGSKVNSADLKNVTGLQGGVLCEISLLGLISVVPAVEYSMVEVKQDMMFMLIPSETTTVNSDIKAAYLAIPVMAKVKFPLGIIAPYLAVGPEFDIVISQKNSMSSRQTYNTLGLPAVVATEEQKDFLKSFAMGINAGGGVEVNLGMLAPFIQASYHMNMTNQLKSAGGKEYLGFNFLNVRVGAKFKL